MNIIKLITYRFNFLLKLKFLLKKTLSEGILIWIFISLFVMINLNFEEGLFPLLLFLIYFHSFLYDCTRLLDLFATEAVSPLVQLCSELKMYFFFINVKLFSDNAPRNIIDKLWPSSRCAVSELNRDCLGDMMC